MPKLRNTSKALLASQTTSASSVHLCRGHWERPISSPSEWHIRWMSNPSLRFAVWIFTILWRHKLCGRAIHLHDTSTVRTAPILSSRMERFSRNALRFKTASSDIWERCLIDSCRATCQTSRFTPLTMKFFGLWRQRSDSKNLSFMGK